jgi:hypothetical protein
VYGAVASGGSSFSTQTVAGHSSTTAIAGVYVGVQYAGGSYWQGWNGEICCVRVWDTNLSDAELLSEMASATPVKTANLRANWRLETGTDLTSTVNSYALTKTGTVNTGSTEPTDIAGSPDRTDALSGSALTGGHGTASPLFSIGL